MTKILEVARKEILNIKPYKGGLSEVQGTDKVIKLSSNENPLGCSEKAKQAYMSVCERLHLYPDGGAHGLRRAISDVEGLEVDNIVCGAGSDELISLLCNAYLNCGDNIVQSKYGFLMYAISAKAAGATAISAPEESFKTSVDSILSCVNDKTKIVFIANPNNPTGSYINKDEVGYLRENLRDDVLLVLDGAYAEYVEEDDYSCGKELASQTNNTIITRTFSKIHGLASLRLGWAYGSSDIIDIINRVRGPFNVSSAALAAGEAAMLDQAFVVESREHNKKQMQKLVRALSGFGIIVHPSVGNFILLDFSELDISAPQVDSLLNEKGIIGRMVAGYQLKNHIRLTIGTDEQNSEVIKVLSDIISK